jgi:hypothetical protein
MPGYEKKGGNYRVLISKTVTSLGLATTKWTAMTLCRERAVLAFRETFIIWHTKLLTLGDQFDGTDWQALIIQALQLRYGPKLVEVPDQHKGDGGIEAFSLDGCAFQCYSPEGQLGLSETAENHKKKITRDLRKFRKNVVRLVAIFGATKIHQWVLVVPNHCSSDVVAHCQKKTAEIQNLDPPLPYVASDFQVLTVNGPTFFAVEIAILTNTGCSLVEAEEIPVAKTDIESFSEQHNELILTLDGKLAKLPMLTEKVARESYREKLLRMHLRGGNALAYYDSNFPVIADKVRSLMGCIPRCTRDWLTCSQNERKIRVSVQRRSGPFWPVKSFPEPSSIRTLR